MIDGDMPDMDLSGIDKLPDLGENLGTLDKQGENKLPDKQGNLALLQHLQLQLLIPSRKNVSRRESSQMIYDIQGINKDTMK